MDLPKWCGFVVVGDNITRKQAKEIIIRTDDLYFNCNNNHRRRLFHKSLGLNVDYGTDWYFPDCDELDKIKKSLGVLELNYLGNRQIMSSYIGGPHGWCQWDGSIGCNSYNIGPWSSVNKVEDEWKVIAETWPFLNLTCELQNEEGEILATYRVKNGKVSLNKSNINTYPQKSFSIRGIFNEEGCSLNKFKNAIKMVKKKMSEKEEKEEEEKEEIKS